MAKLAEARTDPADLINAAVNTLVCERFELPALCTLRRLVGTAHRAAVQGRRLAATLKT
jgi:hypothetical protein